MATVCRLYPSRPDHSYQTNGREDDWRAVQETLYLVSIPGVRESIIEGMATPAEELDGELRW